MADGKYSSWTSLNINMNSPLAYKFKTLRHELFSQSRRIRGTSEFPELPRNFLTADDSEELTPWDISSIAVRPSRTSLLESRQAKPAICHLNELMSTKNSQLNNTQATPKSVHCSSYVASRNNNSDSKVILLPKERKTRSLSPNHIANRKPGGMSNSHLGELLNRKTNL